MDYTKVLEKKKQYPADIRRQVKIYSVNEDTTKIILIGSLSYKSWNASDVDFLEEVQQHDITTLKKFFTKNIKKMVNMLNGRKDQIFCELKCGIDHLYGDVKYGTCSNDTYIMPDNFKQIANDFYSRGFFNDDEIEIINNICGMDYKTQLEYEIIKTLMRKRYILRWSVHDVNRGYKMLQNYYGRPYPYHLGSAIVEHSQINIEGVFINASNNYVECSTFFCLELVEPDGGVKMVNLPALNMNDLTIFRAQFAEQLKGGIYTALYSKYVDYNPLKGLKRLFSYSILTRDPDLARRVYDVINSQIGTLYTLNSQMKTILKVLKSDTSKPVNMETIYHQLDYIRWNIQSIILNDFKNDSVVEFIEDVIANDTQLPINEVIEALEHLTKELSKYINIKAMDMAQRIQLYPLPPNLMPIKPPF